MRKTVDQRMSNRSMLGKSVKWLSTLTLKAPRQCIY
jgi:hypothetical protein